MEKNIKLYNKSCLGRFPGFDELPHKSVDLAYFSPPYNIGTIYGNTRDWIKEEEYLGLLENTIRNLDLVLKNKGVLMIEAADTVFHAISTIQLAGYLQSLCIGRGMSLVERNINFTHSIKNIELPEHGWDKKYTAEGEVHSNCHQFLVFSKDKRPFVGGKIFYVNSVSRFGHPCPTPKNYLYGLVKKYTKSGQTFLDPFMGTGTLGVVAKELRCKFIGYEIDKKIFEVAKRRLS